MICAWIETSSAETGSPPAEKLGAAARGRGGPAAGGRLAAAALAHQTQSLASPDLEGKAVDGFHVGDLALEDEAGRDREVDPQVADVDEDVALGDHRLHGCPRRRFSGHGVTSAAGRNA